MVILSLELQSLRELYHPQIQLGDSGTDVSVSHSHNPDGTYTIEFTINEAGDYIAMVVYTNSAGNFIEVRNSKRRNDHVVRSFRIQNQSDDSYICTDSTICVDVETICQPHGGEPMGEQLELLRTQLSLKVLKVEKQH